MADVLFGKYAPTGVLGHTWPRSMSQVPINIGPKGEKPVEKPLFEYGFGGVATAAAAVLVFMIWFDTPKQDLPVKSPDELEIVLNADNMDLYEDLDFYEWLAGAGNGGSSS